MTELDLAVPLAPNTETWKYRAVDWKEFNEYLNEALARLPPPAPIVTEEEFQSAAKNIDLALSKAVEKHVPKSKPCPYTQRWWTKELTDLKKHANQLSRLSPSAKPGVTVQCWPVLDSVIVFIVRVHLWSTVIALS